MPQIFKKLLFATVMAASLGWTAAQAQIRIGFMTTLSGPGAALGQDQYDAFMLAVEQRNGKLGDSEIRIFKEDDQQKPDVAVQIAQKLIEKKKINLITGVVYSNVMMAIHKPIANAGIFLIGANAGPTPMAGAQCSPYFFSTSWNNDQLHEAGGRLATDLGDKKNILDGAKLSGWKRCRIGLQALLQGDDSGRILHAGESTGLLGRDSPNASRKTGRVVCVLSRWNGDQFRKAIQSGRLAWQVALALGFHRRWHHLACVERHRHWRDYQFFLLSRYQEFSKRNFCRCISEKIWAPAFHVCSAILGCCDVA